MLRRLATISAALTLAACSDGFTSPNDGTRSQSGDGITVLRSIDGRATVPQSGCHGMEGFASPEMLARIPGCRP